VTDEIARRAVSAGGHAISYQAAGPPDGPPVVLLHGLASDSDTWDRALGALAGHGLRAYAVDLLGHGRSDKPVSGYRLDDFADSLAAVLDAVELPAATLCGHSLGGAIAVHFGYHYPERVERLVLVAAGGLGREVSLSLRLLSLPGAEWLTGAVLGRRRVQHVLRSPRVHRLLHLTPARLVNLARIGRTLFRPDLRAAFFRSLRGVIGPSGQRGSFLETEYLAAHVPTLLVWSQRDVIIPVAHAHRTHEWLPGSSLVVFAGGGHQPHHRNAEEFASAVASFVLI
jgi:pimeloyl-ACP methyl ester carboxylesterase